MILVVFIPVFGAYCAWNYPPQWKTLVLTFVMYAFSGISITAGYHRLYSHKSYDAALPVRLFFAFSVPVPLKVQSNGGVILIVFTTDTPILQETHMMPEEASGFLTWDGC